MHLLQWKPFFIFILAHERSTLLWIAVFEKKWSGKEASADDESSLLRAYLPVGACSELTEMHLPPIFSVDLWELDGDSEVRR